MSSLTLSTQQPSATNPLADMLAPSGEYELTKEEREERYFDTFVNRVNPELRWDSQDTESYCPPKHSITAHLLDLAGTRSMNTQRAVSTDIYSLTRDFLLRQYELPTPEYDDIAQLVLIASLCRQADAQETVPKKIAQDISKLFEGGALELPRRKNTSLSTLLPGFSWSREGGKLKMQIEGGEAPKNVRPEIRRADATLVDVVLQRIEETDRSLWPHVFQREIISINLAICKEQRGNQPATIKRRISHLQSFEQSLVDNDLLVGHKEVMRNVKAPKKPKTYQPTFVSEEMEKVIEYLDEQCENEPSSRSWMDQRNRAMFLTLDATYLRNDAVCAMEMKDINLDSGEVYVPNEKGGKKRLLALTEPAVDALRDYIPYRANFLSSKGIAPSKFPYLFCTRHGRKMGHKDFLRLTQDVADAAGIKRPPNGNWGPHSWRRGGATELFLKTGSIETVQQILGHESPTTTQTYLWSGLERHRVRQMKESHPRAKRKK